MNIDDLETHNHSQRQCSSRNIPNCGENVSQQEAKTPFRIYNSIATVFIRNSVRQGDAAR